MGCNVTVFAAENFHVIGDKRIAMAQRFDGPLPVTTAKTLVSVYVSQLPDKSLRGLDLRKPVNNHFQNERTDADILSGTAQLHFTIPRLKQQLLATVIYLEKGSPTLCITQADF